MAQRQPPLRSWMDSVSEAVDAFRKTLVTLLSEGRSEVRVRERKSSSGVLVLNTRGDNLFQILDAGRVLLRDAQKLGDRLTDRATSVLAVHAPGEADECLKPLSSIRGVLGRSATHATSREALCRSLLHSLDNFADTVKGQIPQFDPGHNEPRFVVDANALMTHPSLTDWRLTEQRFCVVLVPEVVRELDKLKTRRETRDTALTLIKQIKEFGRRGAFGGGRATLVKGVSMIECVPLEPRFDDLPAWLDSAHADDRILASTVALSIAHPWSPVCLVTADVNLCNKASFAGVPFYDSDDGIAPAGEVPRKTPRQKRAVEGSTA